MADLNKILLNNTFTFPGGFNIDSTEPIDSRFQVDIKEDLYKDWGNAKVTNKDGVNEAIYKYDGLITYVKSEGKSYRYNSSLLTDENLKGWELVPVLSDIPNIQGISVDGVEIEPDENGIVNIKLPEIPEVVHPEYTLEAGDTNSVKLLKDGESVGEVSISLTTETRSAALLKATEENVGKIILVSGEPEDSEYLNGTYIIDGIGSVKYLATTTGSSVEAGVEELIDNAIKELDSTISAEEGKFLTSITIEDGKLVGSTSDTVSIPEYTIKSNHSSEKTTYTLFKDNVAVEGSIIEVNDSEITFKDGDVYIADKHVLITSDLDDYLVKDIKNGDVLLSLNSDGEVSSTISLKYETKTEGEGEEAVTYPVINLYGKDTKKPISTINASDFIKDGFLSSASYDEKNHKLTLTWNTDSDIKTSTVIDLSGLVDVHDVVGGDGVDDLVKIVVDKKNENGVLTFTVSIDETNLQNKLGELDGKFIKSVVDNDTATYVKVNTDTTDQVVTISVDEEALSTKIGDIEGRLDNIENNTITEGDSVENFVKLTVGTDDNNDVTISIDDSDLKTKIDNIESNFDNYVESVTTLEEQTTLVKIEVSNTDTQNPVFTLDDTDLVNKFDDYLTYDNIDTTKKEGELLDISLTVDENNNLSVSLDETKLNERFEALVDADTKCTSATINVAEATTPTTDEVEVIASQTITLTGTGESLETEQAITSVKVVTKQYVDGKFTEVPTYTAITNSEIDLLFV